MLEQLTLIWYAIMLSTSGMLREQAARTREGDSSAREIRRGSGRSRDKEPVTNRTSITVCQRPCCAPRNVLVRVSAASVLARQRSISVRVRVRSVRTHARVYRQKRNHQLFVLNYPKQVCRARTHAQTHLKRCSQRRRPAESNVIFNFVQVVSQFSLRGTHRKVERESEVRIMYLTWELFLQFSPLQ
jgi:hypothetical protein